MRTPSAAATIVSNLAQNIHTDICCRLGRGSDQRAHILLAGLVQLIGEHVTQMARDEALTQMAACDMAAHDRAGSCGASH